MLICSYCNGEYRCYDGIYVCNEGHTLEHGMEVVEDYSKLNRTKTVKEKNDGSIESNIPLNLKLSMYIYYVYKDLKKYYGFNDDQIFYHLLESKKIKNKKYVVSLNSKGGNDKTNDIFSFNASNNEDSDNCKYFTSLRYIHITEVLSVVYYSTRVEREKDGKIYLFKTFVDDLSVFIKDYKNMKIEELNIPCRDLYYKLECNKIFNVYIVYEIFKKMEKKYFISYDRTEYGTVKNYLMQLIKDLKLTNVYFMENNNLYVSNNKKVEQEQLNNGMSDKNNNYFVIDEHLFKKFYYLVYFECGWFVPELFIAVFIYILLWNSKDCKINLSSLFTRIKEMFDINDNDIEYIARKIKKLFGKVKRKNGIKKLKRVQYYTKKKI
ncbi:hypothetical protein SLOPH_1009 [Spraguea lophii 42_110]|uniref:Uncharacterized protein n=1 Tax=Spraguea lophii (strain 42_110) TaxID=1358809 RepID=S7W7I2_SPRLO|nr:hypothetical protein SLOPH_1009 [Spraguea lophii 42_110]